MLARVIIVLVSSPWYGILITLITVPLMLAFGLVVGMIGSDSMVVAGILLLSSVLVQAVVYAQSARYAGSLTGLQRITEQPDFFRAVGRCLAVTAIVGIFSGLVTAAVLLVIVQLGGADEWWWVDRGKLASAIKIAMASPARAEQIFSFENMNLASLLFVVEAITLFFITLISLFAVPRAIGLGPGYDRGYTPGLILVRLFVAFPFLAALSGLFLATVLALIQKAAGVVIDDIAITAALLYLLEIVLFTGMIFAFEAGLLRTAREEAEEDARRALATTRADTADLRAIRDAWNERS